MFQQTVLSELTAGNMIMILIALFLLYFSAVKGYEIFLLIPVSFGILAVNLAPELVKQSDAGGSGLFYYFTQLNSWGILLPVIFFGIGMLTDFGPLIAKPVNLIFGVAAQSGIFAAYMLASGMGFDTKEAAAAAMTGSVNGPASAFVIGKSGQTELLGPVAVTAYLYMVLGPVVIPKMMGLLTTRKEKAVQMQPLRTVSKMEKIIFDMAAMVLITALLPSVASVAGLMMLGNLLRESGALKFLTDTTARALLYVTLTLLGTAVGAAASADIFLQKTTGKVFLIGFAGMAVGMIVLILCAKLACLVTDGKINPLACAAAGAALPASAQISQKIYQKENQGLSIIPFAMGANAAGLICTVASTGIMLGFMGK